MVFTKPVIWLVMLVFTFLNNLQVILKHFNLEIISSQENIEWAQIWRFRCEWIPLTTGLPKSLYFLYNTIIFEGTLKWLKLNYNIASKLTDLFLRKQECQLMNFFILNWWFSHVHWVAQNNACIANLFTHLNCIETLKLRGYILV